MDTDYVFGRRPNLVVSWLCLRGANSLKTVNDSLTVKEMADRGYQPVMLFNAVRTKITDLEPGVTEEEIIRLIITEGYQIGVFYNPNPNPKDLSLDVVDAKIASSK
jgi:ribulose bisphosphate carboxylase small subunit